MQHLMSMSMEPSFIERVMADIRPQIISLAVRHEIDPDDLLQDTAIRLLTIEDKLIALPNACAYAFGISRHIVHEYRKQSYHHSPVVTMSLDAPLCDDSEVSLSDVLAAPQRQQNHTAEDTHAKIVHQALRRLSLPEQQYMHEVYGLHSYRFRHRQSKRNYDIHKHDQRELVRQQAFRHLRKDASLTEAVEHIYSSR